ncbi:hypothetical protein [uncultured Prevotella sp.]|uniref:hypothetical protein n=1 Tax=uncultured Prevotella sp. TaxID=159272 RepID=UPI002582D9CE|nr:hypothetical protein [uncultured Prevotella sp.]
MRKNQVATDWNIRKKLLATNREEDRKGRWRQKGKVDFQEDATKREGGFSEWWRHIGRVDYQWGATKREGGF